jgi:hypothetical protein
MLLDQELLDHKIMDRFRREYQSWRKFLEMTKRSKIRRPKHLSNLLLLTTVT